MDAADRAGGDAARRAADEAARLSYGRLVA